MASTEIYLNYILDRLKLVDNVGYEEYNGDYLLLKDDVVFGGIFDDCFLVRNTERAKGLIPYAREVKADFYGEKEKMLHVTEIGNRIVVKELVQFIANDVREGRM